MSVSYDVTSCAKLKCIVSCLNFGIEDNFIDGECLMIDIKHAANTFLFAMFLFCFSVMNNLLQHISVIKSYTNHRSFKHVYILMSTCPSEFSH